MTHDTTESATPSLPEGGLTTTENEVPAGTADTPDTSDTHHEIHMVHHNDETIPGPDNDNPICRRGTIASARFNILSTMVGGGCLSLPLAFQQSGNVLVGPILLIVVGAISDFCFRLLVASAIHLNPTHPTIPGKDSFESVTSAAFGPKAYVMSMGLVTAMCFFGAVGYAVLLRDMLEPLNDSVTSVSAVSALTANHWFHKNFMLFVVILLVTPACTLTNFTALQNCGAASMTSILILGTCIVIRSVQCNIHAPEPWYTYVEFFPPSARELLDALPLFISCFVCHYNILPVHNELNDPTPKRVSWWLRSTTWYAVIFYMIMGVAGSSYGHCTESGKVQGNVLLDFDENDSLLMVGRMCLAVTITLAFPMLVMPARDILVRTLILPMITPSEATHSEPPEDSGDAMGDVAQQLQEPLLSDEERPADDGAQTANSQDGSPAPVSFIIRLSTAIAIFWTAGAVASCVKSIDIVWDLLGSSLSILMSYLIPSGCYLVIMRNVSGNYWSKALCLALIIIFVPLMIISTTNAVENTFYSD